MISIEENSEFRFEKTVFGVVDDAEFKFEGLEMKFERNWRKGLQNSQNQISGPKIQNRNRISGFEVPISYFSGIRFFRNGNLKFWQSRKL